jgi:phage N-6-adenine-methyltransferase
VELKLVSKSLFSSENQYWNTPKWFFDELNKEFNFQLDACTSSNNPLGTPNFYTEEIDGLAPENRWLNPTFVNPPYGRKNKMDRWLERACYESLEGNTVVMLLPSRTGTKWFHKWIWNKEIHSPRFNYEVRFLEGRLSFDYDHLRTHYEKSKNTAPFDSMVVIFR